MFRSSRSRSRSFVPESAYAGSISIDAPYSVHVNLPGYPMDLNFDPSSANRSVF